MALDRNTSKEEMRERQRNYEVPPRDPLARFYSRRDVNPAHGRVGTGSEHNKIVLLCFGQFSPKLSAVIDAIAPELRTSFSTSGDALKYLMSDDDTIETKTPE